jgi:MFS family permease
MGTIPTGPKRVVAASVVGLAFGYSTIGVASFGIFVVPLSEHFGWGRGDMSLGLTLMSLTIVLLSPFTGALLDRFGVRKVLIPATALFALAVAGMALLTGSLWHFYLMHVLLALAGVCTAPVSYSRVIVAWFDRHRGLALGIALAGIGLGTALVPPFVQLLSARFGWRSAYLGLGLVILCVALPFLLAWIRDPRKGAQQAAANAELSGGSDFSAGVRSRVFALLVVSFVLLGIFTAGILAHLVPLLVDRGVPPRSAAGIASVMGLALIVGRLLTGYLLDRLFAPVVVVIFLLGPVAGIAWLAAGATGPGAMVAVVLIGLGLGAEIDFMSYLVSRYFALSAFGRIYGLIYAALTVGLSIGPIVMGYSQQLTGSYDLALRILLGASILAILPFLGLGRYPAERAAG